MLVAALYVERPGVYCIPNVDAWDVIRDARSYAGSLPVVAHPPCERWGRYWGGGPMLHGTSKQKTLGDDGGCFAAALAAVNRCGGVLEHPEATHAFKAYGLAKPPRNGGWIRSGIGWVCWGPASGKHRIDNCRERKRGTTRSKLHGAELRATPIQFRNVLLDLAFLSRCYPSE